MESCNFGVRLEFVLLVGGEDRLAGESSRHFDLVINCNLSREAFDSDHLWVLTYSVELILLLWDLVESYLLVLNL